MGDELVIHMSADTSFASNVYVAHRESASGTFSTPSPVSENSTGGDTPSWLSPDACRLYITRAGEGAFTYRLFVATRH